MIKMLSQIGYVSFLFSGVLLPLLLSCFLVVFGVCGWLGTQPNSQTIWSGRMREAINPDLAGRLTLPVG